eukprot:TRINITY_DN31771_c0_g1_i1.p1 TRINITY_DN31771_c0_g1~~TRINITY_DN31771_c0_g1_i1.p1  ORF type:complete len:463 (-),score=69.84 TRINITY_DN31771_c0_g1_i1:75-1418(-)
MNGRGGGRSRTLVMNGYGNNDRPNAYVAPGKRNDDSNGWQSNAAATQGWNCGGWENQNAPRSGNSRSGPAQGGWRSNDGSARQSGWDSRDADGDGWGRGSTWSSPQPSNGQERENGTGQRNGWDNSNTKTGNSGGWGQDNTSTSGWATDDSGWGSSGGWDTAPKPVSPQRQTSGWADIPVPDKATAIIAGQQKEKRGSTEGNGWDRNKRTHDKQDNNCDTAEQRPSSTGWGEPPAKQTHTSTDGGGWGASTGGWGGGGNQESGGWDAGGWGNTEQTTSPGVGWNHSTTACDDWGSTNGSWGGKKESGNWWDNSNTPTGTSNTAGWGAGSTFYEQDPIEYLLQQEKEAMEETPARANMRAIAKCIAANCHQLVDTTKMKQPKSKNDRVGVCAGDTALSLDQQDRLSKQRRDSGGPPQIPTSLRVVGVNARTRTHVRKFCIDTVLVKSD